MRIDASIPRSPIGTIITELFSENEGKTLNAIIASVKDEMVLLVFNQKVVLQARTMEPLQLSEGQRIELVVAAATDEEIQLQMTGDCSGDVDKTVLTLEKPLQAKPLPTVPGRDIRGAADKAPEDEFGERIVGSAEIKRAATEIKEIIRHKENLLSSSGVESEELLTMPVKKLHGIAVESRTRSIHSNKGAENQDLRFLDELETVRPDDISRLLRLDRELNVFNLLIAKTVREGKDFLKPLLKELFRLNNLQTDTDGKNTLSRHPGDGFRIQRLTYKDIVNAAARENPGTKAGTSTTLNVLAEKAVRVSRALDAKDCIILPFVFNGGCEEALALIRNKNSKKGGPKEAGRHIEVELIVRLPNLGEVRAVVSIMNRDLSLRFFAENDHTVRLIAENKDILIENAGEKGYNLLAVSSSELGRKFFHSGDTIIDMRV